MEKPERKVVARIAIAINEFGQWAAWGRWDMRDGDSLNEANGNVGQDGPQACYYIDVEVPIPKPEVLQAVINIGEPVKVVDYKEPEKTK